MELENEAEILELVEHLDRVIPKDGAHLTIGADPDGNTTVGNRLGYLRFGLEFLSAALRPLPSSESAPDRIVPDLDRLLTEGSGTPFDLCELDEAIGSRPPIRSALGPLGELFTAVIVVAALILVVLAGAVVVRWMFG